MIWFLCAAGHYLGQGGSVREVHSVLVLLWWWSGQQLACLTESSNVRSSLLREDEAPAVHSFPSLFHPYLPAAGFMSSPGLSSISVTHRPHYWGCTLVGLQMGRACRIYMVSAARTKACESDRRNMWSSGCGQDNVFSMFVKKWTECENVPLPLAVEGCVGWLKLTAVLELVWPLGI